MGRGIRMAWEHGELETSGNASSEECRPQSQINIVEGPRSSLLRANGPSCLRPQSCPYCPMSFLRLPMAINHLRACSKAAPYCRKYPAQLFLISLSAAVSIISTGFALHLHASSRIVSILRLFLNSMSRNASILVFFFMSRLQYIPTYTTYYILILIKKS